MSDNVVGPCGGLENRLPPVLAIGSFGGAGRRFAVATQPWITAYMVYWFFRRKAKIAFFALMVYVALC